MCFGLYVFAISTTAYDSLRRRLAWRHPSTARIGRRPVSQFLGQDDETIALSGRVYPELTKDGIPSLEDLEGMGDSGEAYLLVGGDNKVWGNFVIESLELTHSEFLPNGTPLKIEFNMSLKRVDDDDQNG